MRYVLKIEAIGDNYRASAQRWLRGQTASRGAMAQTLKLGAKRLSPWVARLTGLDSQNRIQRDFVKAQKDWSDANGTGSRGVWLWYFLEPGIYEINQRETWHRTRRYFARVIDERTLVEMSREEVLRCLAKDILA